VDFFKSLLVLVSPAASGIVVNAIVEAGRRGQKARKSLQPGMVLVTKPDGTKDWQATGAWNLKVVVTDNWDDTKAMLQECAASFIKRALHGENGGKPSADLVRRVERAFVKIMERYPSFQSDVLRFVRKATEPGKAKKSPLLKVRFHGERCPDTSFRIANKASDITKFQEFAISLNAELVLSVGETEETITLKTPEEVFALVAPSEIEFEFTEPEAELESVPAEAAA
jgi:hypothetical protein